MLTPKEFETIEKQVRITCDHQSIFVSFYRVLAILRAFTEPDEPEAPPDGEKQDG